MVSGREKSCGRGSRQANRGKKFGAPVFRVPPAFTRAGLRLLRRAIPPSGIWSVPCSPPERARPYWEASQVEQALSLPSRTTKVRREPMRSPRRAAFQNRPSPSFRSRVGGSPMAASSSNEPPVAGVGVAFAAGAEAAPLSRSRCFALLYTQPACQFRPTQTDLVNTWTVNI